MNIDNTNFQITTVSNRRIKPGNSVKTIIYFRIDNELVKKTSTQLEKKIIVALTDSQIRHKSINTDNF